MIAVDVSGLEIGKTIHIGEIVAPAGVEILGDKHISVLAVKAPVTEAEATATDAAATATGEVEMTKEKKEDGSAAKAPAGDKGAAKADDKKAGEKKK